MAKGKNQKFKLYRLAQIMLEKTDEDHFLTMAEIKEELARYEITAERKSLYNDLRDLEVLGIEVAGEPCGGGYRYHVVERPFEIPELKLLVDVIQSSKFITARKSNQLIAKLEKLASKYEASALQRQVFVAGRIKTMNETIYYNVDTIHGAIAKNRKIHFQYYQWNVKKEMELRHGGAYYHISPWGLSWDAENYYLVGYDSDAEQIKHYRVDKMQNTEILETDRKGEESFKNFDLAAFAKKTFGMYGGVDAEVTLECKNELAGVIIDRFGHDVWLIPQGEDHFKTRVLVSVSPQFFGWVTGIGSGMKITGPDNVKSEYKAYLQDVLENY